MITTKHMTLSYALSLNLGFAGKVGGNQFVFLFLSVSIFVHIFESVCVHVSVFVFVALSVFASVFVYAFVSSFLSVLYLYLTLIMMQMITRVLLAELVEMRGCSILTVEQVSAFLPFFFAK